MLPSFRLDDQVALVTGAASGIGREIAIGLAEAGAAVGCVDSANDSRDRRRDRRPIAAPSPPADVTDARLVSAAVAAVEDALGPLRLAVNCAGIANAAPAEDMPLEQFGRSVDVNVNGVFLCCQAEGRAMLRNGRGAIVNIASMSGSIVNRDLLQVALQRLQGGRHPPQQVAGDGVGAARHPRQQHLAPATPPRR